MLLFSDIALITVFRVRVILVGSTVALIVAA